MSLEIPHIDQFCFNQVRTIDYANQNLKGGKKYKSELKYKNVDIQYVHYGTYSSKAHQVRKVILVRCKPVGEGDNS